MASTHLRMRPNRTKQHQKQIQNMTESVLPSPPCSPERSRTHSSKLSCAERDDRLDTSPQRMPKFLPPSTLKSTLRKSALKKPTTAFGAKAVSWHPDVIDNSSKERLRPRIGLLMPKLSVNDFRVRDAAYSPGVKDDDVMTPSPGMKTRTASNEPINGQQIYSGAVKIVQNSGVSFSEDQRRTGQSKLNHKHSSSPKNWMPPAVPDAPPRPMQRARTALVRLNKNSNTENQKVEAISDQLSAFVPPPTPRPKPLPTPDLPDIGDHAFCECCTPWQSPISHHEQEGWIGRKSKWEVQYENAVAHIENSKRI